MAKSLVPSALAPILNTVYCPRRTGVGVAVGTGVGVAVDVGVGVAVTTTVMTYGVLVASRVGVLVDVAAGGIGVKAAVVSVGIGVLVGLGVGEVWVITTGVSLTTGGTDAGLGVSVAGVTIRATTDVGKARAPQTK
jgi:hypothetical protein